MKEQQHEPRARWKEKRVQASHGDIAKFLKFLQSNTTATTNIQTHV